jgi:uncharacterized protein
MIVKKIMCINTTTMKRDISTMEYAKDSEKIYLMSPKKIHRHKSLPYDCDFAIICYCPMQRLFDRYEIEKSKRTIDGEEIRYFLHTNPLMVKHCETNSYKFIVVSEVYGGSVGVTTVEELYFYGVRKIIGIGFVGSMCDLYPIGTNLYIDQCLIDQASIDQGSTSDYLDNPGIRFVSGSENTLSMINDVMIPNATVWTIKSIYREKREDVPRVTGFGCHVVNMDTSHLYSSANRLSIHVTYYATVSNIFDDDWNDSIDSIDNILATGLESIVSSKRQEQLIENVIHHNTKGYIDAYKKRTKQLFDQHNVCESHGYQHAIAVMNNVIRALQYQNYGLNQRTIEMIILAALLHDVDDKKFFPNHTNVYQNARMILYDKHPKFVESVVEMINLVSCRDNGNRLVADLWKLIPRYADRLEALGINGIERCYQYTMTLGNPLIIESTPRPRTMDEVFKFANDRTLDQYKGQSLSMIDHYYDKLLHLGTFPPINDWLSHEAINTINIMADFVLKFCENDMKKNIDQHQFVKEFIADNKKMCL